MDISISTNINNIENFCGTVVYIRASMLYESFSK